MLAVDTLRFDAQTGEIEGRTATLRHLGDLADCFANPVAYQQALTAGNPLLYRVTQIEDAKDEGDLHYGLAILYPGQVGDEYYMTKGHFHAWRPAAEVYIGLAGQGLMLLEDERSGECRAVPLEANRTVYVPGYTAHRTINIGKEALIYWGILSSRAGHDYGSIGQRNFRQVVVEVAGRPTVMERSEYLQRMG